MARDDGADDAGGGAVIAYLLETTEGEIEIAADNWPMPEYAGATILSVLKQTASFDHGLRTADETAFVIGCEAAACIMAPLLCAIWNRPLDSWRFDVDYVAALPKDLAYNGSGWADDPDVSEWLYEWSDEMVGAAQNVGWVIETSVDAGMTWFYCPLVDES